MKKNEHINNEAFNINENKKRKTSKDKKHKHRKKHKKKKDHKRTKTKKKHKDKSKKLSDNGGSNDESVNHSISVHNNDNMDNDTEYNSIGLVDIPTTPNETPKNNNNINRNKPPKPKVLPTYNKIVGNYHYSLYNNYKNYHNNHHGISIHNNNDAMSTVSMKAIKPSESFTINTGIDSDDSTIVACSPAPIAFQQDFKVNETPTAYIGKKDDDVASLASIDRYHIQMYNTPVPNNNNDNNNNDDYQERMNGIHMPHKIHQKYGNQNDIESQIQRDKEKRLSNLVKKMGDQMALEPKKPSKLAKLSQIFIHKKGIKKDKNHNNNNINNGNINNNNGNNNNPNIINNNNNNNHVINNALNNNNNINNNDMDNDNNNLPVLDISQSKLLKEHLAFVDKSNPKVIRRKSKLKNGNNIMNDDNVDILGKKIDILKNEIIDMEQKLAKKKEQLLKLETEQINILIEKMKAKNIQRKMIDYIDQNSNNQLNIIQYILDHN